MTHRRVLVPPERIEGAVARPDPASLHYLSDVLRLEPGSEVEVFDGAGNAWTATFTGSELDLGERRAAALPGVPGREGGLDRPEGHRTRRDAARALAGRALGGTARG
jgi:hypothetical protein